MEADLQRHYGVALTGIVTGELSWRRLGVLIRKLPNDSALNRELHGNLSVEWTPLMEQVSQIKHTLQMANWQRAGVKGASRPKPDKRPGDDQGQRIGGTSRPQEQVRALLDSFAPQEVAHGDNG